MAVGLFWNDRVSFEKHEWAKRFFFLGNNTGNLVFIRALKDIFHPVMIPLWDVTSDTFRDRADITHYITTDLADPESDVPARLDDAEANRR